MKFNLYPILLCCCLLVKPAVAQISTNTTASTFTVTQNQPVSMAYESIDELSADKLISNVFTLHFNDAAATYNVYCNVVCTGTPNEALAQQIVLKPSGATGNSSNQLRLSLTPQLLMEHHPGNAAVFSYDAVVRRQVTRIPPGNYDFTLQFTLNQP